ncbi:pygopus homolog 1 isoform X2 [Neofelis nebulosa]|uniref:pygopus homolog 1 isoform X2 n=1 Tax=Neofelis nebulosa TaxID=61452 RepID=UPI00272BAC7B|nr:pygopus homolog 1 isoform X2 [Neofelis nebulosa]XP_058593638.1 pygopus homolog 1 isoform X2 [Neofelis nebulosa]XP_058593639.1 pygopus homolog 1 isoform X2 [Neofelis nebulosa]
MWVSTSRPRTLQLPLIKFSRIVRSSFRSLAARPRCPLWPPTKFGDAISSQKLGRGAPAAEPGVLRPGGRQGKPGAGLGGAAPRRATARPGCEDRGLASPGAEREARAGRGGWAEAERETAVAAGAAGPGSGPRPPKSVPARGWGAQGGEAAGPRHVPRPPQSGFCRRLQAGGFCVCDSGAARAQTSSSEGAVSEPPGPGRPPPASPVSGSRGGGGGEEEGVGGGGGGALVLRTCRPRAGGRPQAALPAAAAEPRQPPHAARPPGGLVFLPNFAKSASVPAALGRASARRLASQPQRPREEEEEPPPQHQRDRIPAAWGGVMLCGL